jgi:hypothetical protein
MTRRGIATALALVAAVRAEGGSRGSNGTASTAPATKSAGAAAETAELPGRDGPIEPRHGILGAPVESVATAPPTWRSGDRVRSRSSADVRQARQQQAPDLEFVGAADAKAQGAPGTGKEQR